MKQSAQVNQEIIRLHAAIQRFRALGCWGLAEALEGILNG